MNNAAQPSPVDQQPAPRSEWLTVKHACAYADCSRQTLWRWQQQGLRTGRSGRVRRSDLESWLAKERQDQAQLPSDDGEFFTFRQAAQRAGITRQTLWRWRNDGLKVELRGGVTRIRADVLNAYLQRGR